MAPQRLQGGALRKQPPQAEAAIPRVAHHTDPKDAEVYLILLRVLLSPCGGAERGPTTTHGSPARSGPLLAAAEPGAGSGGGCDEGHPPLLEQALTLLATRQHRMPSPGVALDLLPPGE